MLKRAQDFSAIEMCSSITRPKSPRRPKGGKSKRNEAGGGCEESLPEDKGPWKRGGHDSSETVRLN